jgi:putative peptidoglycan lipid II flippase
MRNDEQQPPQKPKPAYTGWTYDQEQPPMSPPAGRPPSGYLANTSNNAPDASSGPLFDSAYNPASQIPPDAYYPDLTMDMGTSLGYSQSLQHRAGSMPQPTQSLPRLRQERLQQLRQERMQRKQRRLGPDITAMIASKEHAGIPIGANPQPMLQPAAAPAQDTSMIQRVKVARASSIIGGAFLISSILGLLQTFLFTYIFGRGAAGESYLQAYLIPNLIFTVIAGGALSSAFIPVFTSYAVKEQDEKTAWHIASSALNLSVLSMISLSIIAFFLAPLLVPLYTRTEEIPLTITLTRIMLIQAIVLGSGVIVGAVLNTKQNFTYTALGTVLYNVGLNLGLLPGFFMTFHAQGVPSSTTAVYIATWGVVLGALLQVGVQIPGLFKVNMRYTFAFDWRHPGVITIARQMVPRIINAIMLSFSTAVDRFFLSWLSSGLINAYLQSFSILLLPVSLFGSSVSTAAFPTLASYAARERFERVRSIIMETLRGILFLTIPSAVGLAVLSFPITQGLLEHGNFDLTATRFASITLFFFSLGLPSLAAVEILTRSFYALQDSRTPVTISVIQFIVKIALNIILINVAIFGIQWGLGALALSTSIASTFEAFVLFLLLSRRIGSFDLQDFTAFLWRAFMASGAMGVVLFVLQFLLNHMIDTTSMQKLFIPGILKALTKVFIELGIGSAIFLIVARLLKMEEMNTGLVRRVINLLHIPWL